MGANLLGTATIGKVLYLYSTKDYYHSSIIKNSKLLQSLYQKQNKIPFYMNNS